MKELRIVLAGFGGQGLLFAGKVIWGIALITAACSLAGNYIGSGLAIKKNPAFIRVMLTVVCGLLLVKLGYDVLF